MTLPGEKKVMQGMMTIDFTVVYVFNLESEGR